MLLRKEQGGTEITHHGRRYHWPTDGAVTDVPDDLGMALLGIKDGGYTVHVPAEVPVTPPVEVAEPGPPLAAEVTEPAPKTSAGRRGRPPVTEGR